MPDVESYTLVLIVEPDETALSDMVKALRRAGYQTTGTSTFERAREQIQLDPPRVLLTGARLGAYSGLHLALLAQQRRTDCQAIILTPAADPVLEREAIEVGAVFMVKPVPAPVLPPLLETLLGRPPGTSSSSFTAAAAAEAAAERRRAERRRLIIPGFAPERRVAERRRD